MVKKISLIFSFLMLITFLIGSEIFVVGEVFTQTW